MVSGQYLQIAGLCGQSVSVCGQYMPDFAIVVRVSGLKSEKLTVQPCNISFFLFSSVDIGSLSFHTMELYGRQLLKI